MLYAVEGRRTMDRTVGQIRNTITNMRMRMMLIRTILNKE